VIGGWFLVIGYWLMVIGCWFDTIPYVCKLLVYKTNLHS